MTRKGTLSLDSTTRRMGRPPHKPRDSYRHAAPSGPWPWMDFDSNPTLVQPPRAESPIDSTWRDYPHNLFRHWTSDQIKRSKIMSGCCQVGTCSVHKVDVLSSGIFDDMNHDQSYVVSSETADEFWNILLESRPDHIRARALFLDNLTLPVLQMLGTKYNIEPFFFSSSINWIPSRYQDEMRPSEGDHLTITLPFIRSLQNRDTLAIYASLHLLMVHLANNVLVQDLLAVHMVRTSKSSTIISYHPNSGCQRTSAKRLQSLVQRAGQNLYWQRIFAKSDDPTFLLLAILWYVLYAWDEAFEALYMHTNWLVSDIRAHTMQESRVLSTNNISLTSEMHNVQAHLLQYQSLLQDFRRSVSFIKHTPNPAMDGPTVTSQERKESAELLSKECGNLIYEIDRLEGRRYVQSSRLKNIIDFAFAIVNIEDSRHTQKLAEATVRDSAAMKQAISPNATLSFCHHAHVSPTRMQAVFGMNVTEINPGSAESLIHYVEATIALTIFTVWLIVSLQSHSSVHKHGCSVWRRIGWPIFYATDLLAGTRARFRDSKGVLANV
ncbi:hypothetical protein HYDPIDRAFT_175727 [Hydnomerulius pinastri MD-312]|uniref:Uncharacterized protein n=1 Tax=Hydnomerulius pinastri MD-312 TaxID=994086 RepID=A0A0C9WF71_9AGAM|nr:hypothetical protein HYDPIDRAFT_175727 [Hydnomerulius pinastri MD-312]